MAKTKKIKASVFIDKDKIKEHEGEDFVEIEANEVLDAIEELDITTEDFVKIINRLVDCLSDGDDISYSAIAKNMLKKYVKMVDPSEKVAYHLIKATIAELEEMDDW